MIILLNKVRLVTALRKININFLWSDRVVTACIITFLLPKVRALDVVGFHSRGRDVGDLRDYVVLVRCYRCVCWTI